MTPVDIVPMCEDHEPVVKCPKSACEVCALRERRADLQTKLDQLTEGYFRNTSEEEARLRLMEQGDRMWDLSYNDRCAIAWVLDALKFTRTRLKQAKAANNKLLAEQKEETRQDREMIRILWENGEFGQSCKNALSKDVVLRRALKGEKAHD